MQKESSVFLRMNRNCNKDGQTDKGMDGHTDGLKGQRCVLELVYANKTSQYLIKPCIKYMEAVAIGKQE